MESILEVKDLKKNYGDFAAVKGITFDIKEGEIFSLLGPNGAGKTTTISMLSTLYTPTSGDAPLADIPSRKSRWRSNKSSVWCRRNSPSTKT
jgi:ABC-2 type transport system ATP-binding protein